MSVKCGGLVIFTGQTARFLHYSLLVLLVLWVLNVFLVFLRILFVFCVFQLMSYLTPAGVYIVFRCVDTIGGDILDVGGETA